jgi:quercetin dioxygenase-like cupin family protein
MTTTSRASKTRSDGAPASDCVVVDLDEAVALVERQAHRQPADRTARSLFQTASLGTVLTAIREGGAVHNDQPDEAATIQGLRGECLISLRGQGAVVQPGTFVGVPAGVPWRLVARSGAVVLLTLSRA